MAGESSVSSLSLMNNMDSDEEDLSLDNVDEFTPVLDDATHLDGDEEGDDPAAEAPVLAPKTATGTLQ